MVWNKGLTKETDERVRKYSKSISNIMSEFKGKTFEDRFGKEKANEIRKKLCVSNSKPKNPNSKANYSRAAFERERKLKKLGKKELIARKHSEYMKNLYEKNPKIRENLSLKTKEHYRLHPELAKMHSNYMKQYYKEHPEAIEKIKEARSKQIFPKFMTKCEVKMKKILDDLDLSKDFKWNGKIERYHYDFISNKYMTAIECDGDFWHANPKIFSRGDLYGSQEVVLKVDKKKNEAADRNDYQLLRFFESDIIGNEEDVKIVLESKLVER